MGIAVLGPLEVDGRANGLSPRDRVVLSALVVRAGEPITTEALADVLWGDAQPASWAKVVHGCVSRLRKQLGAGAIESGGAGYRLAVQEREVDSRAFERQFARAREVLDSGDPERAAYLVEEALTLWRGRPLVDLEEWEPGRLEAARLEGLRMDADELLVDARTRAGHGRDVVEQARALVAEAPFRERRCALLAIALHQSGRQAEALAALRRARSMLVGELGLDPGHELVDLEEQLLRHDPSLDAVASSPADETCPYRGLLSYDAADADTFFGRDADAEACLRRLRDTGVLAVVGPSGVGKSSLVRAGVVASLLRSGTPVLVTSPGDRPTEALRGWRPGGRQALVVDQAEEAVALCTDPEEQERYFSALVAHVEAGGPLVLSMRTDHLDDLGPFPAFARVVEDGLYLLGPMGEAELRCAIEGPARRAGLRLEVGLVDLLVREVEGEPGALPMLSHVLRGTWEQREGPTLTVEGYRATGGIGSAVSQSAENLYDALDPAQRSRLRTLLLRLVTLTEDGAPVRARVPRARVAADDQHDHLVERLVRARLVSIDGDSVQIAHEALVRAWPRLRGWLDDDVDGQRVFRHLAGAADAWQAMGRPDSELYRGSRLERAQEWRDRAAPDLSEVERAFLDASAALSDSELRTATTRVAAERRANRRLRTALAGVAVLLAAALVAGVLALHRAELAREQRVRAERLAADADAAAARSAVGTASAQAVDEPDLATALLVQVAALQADDRSPQMWENLASTLVRAGPLRLNRVPTGDGAMSVSADVSTDGALVATSNPVDGVQLYDAETLTPVPFGDDTPSSIVRFSPDGRHLVAAVNQWTGQALPRIVDLPVRIYDLPGGTLAERQLGGWFAGANVEYTLDFDTDGSRLAAMVHRWDHVRGTWRRVGAAMVWDLASPEQPLLRVPTPDDSTLALSPDGERLYVLTHGRPGLRVYDVASGRVVASGPVAASPRRSSAPDPDDVAVSPDGRLLAVGAGDQVALLDAGTLRRTGPVLRGAAGGENVEFSRDGTMLLTMSLAAGTTVWDVATGEVVRRLGVIDGWDLRFSPDSAGVYASGFGVLQAWDVAARRAFLADGAATSGTGTLALSVPAPDGRTIARRSGDELWFVDDVTGRRTAPAHSRLQVERSAWSPDSRLFATASAGDLTVWDARTGRRVGQRRFARDVTPIASFGPDSDRVYVADGRGFVQTLDSRTLARELAPVVVGEVMAIAVLPRDDTLLVLSSGGTLMRVNPSGGDVAAQTHAVFLDPDDYDSEGMLGAVSPDGGSVVVRHPDGVLRLLRTDDLGWVDATTLPGWGGNVDHTSDGSQFASVAAGQLRISDGRTGDLLARVPLPSGAGDAAVAYRPGGTELLVSAIDGRTWTIDTRLSTWTDRACEIAGRNLTKAEWRLWFPDRPYAVSCPGWPAGT